jgi:hypothetical protein
VDAQSPQQRPERGGRQRHDRHGGKQHRVSAGDGVSQRGGNDHEPVAHVTDLLAADYLAIARLAAQQELTEASAVSPRGEADLRTALITRDEWLPRSA